jgi:autotransporter passenger strand-loop-strand repeat protein
VSSGGVTRQTSISGGTEAVLSGGTAIHTAVRAGGIETVGGLTASSTIAGGTLDLLSGGTATGTILFAGSGLLAVQGTTLPGTTISGFAVSDGIDLASVLYTGSGTTAFDSSTGVLTVNEGGSSYHLTLAGDYADDTFALGPDTGSGTLVTLETVPCFVAGTLILTDRGEVPIEELAIGDHVMTHEGEAAPILWIGHRRIDCDRHAAPAKVWPVRIAAHAFGPGSPHRDLLLSPDHAILTAGVLIPVKHLINERSIRQLRRRAVSYFHIRLAHHTALLANGLPAESYLDTGDIGGFTNGPGAVALHPAFGCERADIALVMDALGCAPFRVTGPEVAAVRARLAVIAASSRPRRRASS